MEREWGLEGPSCIDSAARRPGRSNASLVQTNGQNQGRWMDAVRVVDCFCYVWAWAWSCFGFSLLFFSFLNSSPGQVW